MAKGSGNNRTVSSTTATTSRATGTSSSRTDVSSAAIEMFNSFNGPAEVIGYYSMAKTFNKNGSITNADLKKIEKAAKSRMENIEKTQISNISSLKIPNDGAMTKVPMGDSDAFVMHVQESSNSGHFHISLPNGKYRDYYYDKMIHRNTRDAWKQTKDFMKDELREIGVRAKERFRKYKKS